MENRIGWQVEQIEIVPGNDVFVTLALGTSKVRFHAPEFGVGRRGREAAALAKFAAKNGFGNVKKIFDFLSAGPEDWADVAPLKLLPNNLEAPDARNGFGNGNGNGKGNTPRKKSVVGPPLNFRNMAYSPIFETGVVFLFGMIAAELGFLIEEVRTEFPDCIARRRCGDRWEQVAIEFEWNSKKFSVHEDDNAACDLCVCWIHDYPDCPVEVLELRKVLKTLPNPPFCPPDSQATRN